MANKLFRDVAGATGLPQDWVQDELSELIKKAGFQPETLSLEQLRIVLADHLQDVFLANKNVDREG